MLFITISAQHSLLDRLISCAVKSRESLRQSSRRSLAHLANQLSTCRSKSGSNSHDGGGPSLLGCISDMAMRSFGRPDTRVRFGWIIEKKFILIWPQIRDLAICDPSHFVD
jgi:hypothetical protein